MTAAAAALLSRARSRREAYRTERALPKAVMDVEGRWITVPHVLTRTEQGLSDRPADNNRRQKP